MKKISVLFATVIIMALFAFSASALEPTGQCGDNVYWTFNESTGELVISGEGDMWDYENNYGESPFYNVSEIQNVVIEEGVTSIGDYTFCYARKMRDVKIPDSVTAIGKCAFEMCMSLTDVLLPDSVTNFGIGAFYACSGLKNINIPDGVTSIVDFMFVGTAIEKIDIPDSVTSINANAFHGCGCLEYLEIPENVTTIGDYAFAYCPFKEITIPDGVTGIGEGVFYACENLETVKFPKSISTIESYMFYLCTNLKTIEIPAGVISIGLGAFAECTNLESIIIPNSVTNIDMGAFYLCSGFSDVYYSGSEEQWKNISIDYELNEPLEKANIHYNYSTHSHEYSISEIVEPTCTEEGYTVYLCECGDKYNSDFQGKKNHNMNGWFCDICGEECFCICHAKTIGAFVYRLFKLLDAIFDIDLLGKVFGISEICSCGVAHY